MSEWRTNRRTKKHFPRQKKVMTELVDDDTVRILSPSEMLEERCEKCGTLLTAREDEEGSYCTVCAEEEQTGNRFRIPSGHEAWGQLVTFKEVYEIPRGAEFYASVPENDHVFFTASGKLYLRDCVNNKWEILGDWEKVSPEQISYDFESVCDE